jgi:hypothetical protein
MRDAFALWLEDDDGRGARERGILFRTRSRMTDEPVPPEVRVFLLECIDSVGELEALILLHEAPQQEWTVPDLARRLYVDEGEAAKILSGLVGCELAVTDGTAFKIYAGDAEHQQVIESVARTYSRCLVPVTKLIHDKASGIQRLADAFKFRKER